MQSGRSDNRPALMPLVYYSWAKASRSWFSCSSGRLVEMTSKSYCLSSSTTLSTAVAPLVSANRAEVPSVTFSRTCLIKSSSIPTSDNEPDIAPTAAPRKGTKKIIPIRNPQNAPQPAPPPCSWRVLGFLLPCGQLTTAASSRVIICRSCRPSRAMSTLSAPPGSLNFSTDSVAILYSLSFALDRTTPLSIASSRSTSVAAAVRGSPSLLQIRHRSWHSGKVPLGSSYPNFLDLRLGEVRRTLLLGTSMNKGQKTNLTRMQWAATRQRWWARRPLELFSGMPVSP